MKPLIVFLFCSTTLFGSPLYYVAPTAWIQTNLPTTTLGGGGYYALSGPTGELLQQTSYTLSPTLDYSASVTAIDPIIGGLYTVSAGADVDFLAADGQTLHGEVQSSGATSDPYFGGSGIAYGSLLWEDTLYTGGLPVGTPVLLQVTTSFDGSYSVSGDSDESALTWIPYLTQNTIDNVCGPASNYITELNSTDVGNAAVEVTTTSNLSIDSVHTFDFCITVGAPLTLEEQLILQAGGVDTWSAEAEARDTGTMYIDVLTPGATLTSASGVNYSTPSAVPEPSMSFLTCFAATLLAIVYRHRLARKRLSESS